MEKWDPQMMLDLYLHNYLTKKNMHTTAEIFAREANFYPQEVAIQPPEGFLSEWWSIFWSIFSARFPENSIQDNNGTAGPSNCSPAMPSHEFNHMLPNMPPTMPPGFAGPSIMQPPEFNNFFESDFSRLMMSMPDNENLLGSNLSGMMLRPENVNLFESDLPRTLMSSPENGSLLGNDISRTIIMRPDNVNLLENDLQRTMMPGFGNGNLLGSDLSRTTMPRLQNTNFLRSDFPRMMVSGLEDGNLLGSTFSGMMIASPENRSFPVSDVPIMSSNSQATNVDRLFSIFPSSINLSYEQRKVYKNPQLCLTRADKCGSNFRRSTAAAEPSNFSPKPHEPKLKSLLETDSRSPVKNLNFNSHSNDSPVRSLPSSTNFSDSPPEKVHEEAHQLSVKSDDKSGDRSCSSAPAEAARFMQGKMEHDADARRVFEPERYEFLGVGRAAQLPSGSNFSGTKKNKKQCQLTVACKRYGAGLKRPAQLALKDISTKIEPADDTDARASAQVHLGPPPGMELDSNLQLEDIDQLPLLPASPSKHCSNVSKNGKLSFTQDDGSDNNLERAADVEPTDSAPEVIIEPKITPAKIGSSSSSNSESSDPSS